MSSLLFRRLRAYESHLSTVALSNVESSRTVSQILFEMANATDIVWFCHLLIFSWNVSVDCDLIYFYTKKHYAWSGRIKPRRSSDQISNSGVNVIIYFPFTRNIPVTNKTVARKHFFLNKQCCSIGLVPGREGIEKGSLLSSVLGEKLKWCVVLFCSIFINIQPSKSVKLSYQSTNQCCGINDQFLKSSQTLTILTRKWYPSRPEDGKCEPSMYVT